MGASAQDRPQLKALAFDAYGTLFDIQSLATTAEELFPGHGQALAQLWRTRQLEYTWLISLMDRYEDFGRITRRALAQAAKLLGLPLDEAAALRLMEAYLRLPPHGDVPGALEALGQRYPLAILSNGSPQMLQPLLENAGLARLFTAILSADEAAIYKPSPRVYILACHRLNLTPIEIGFVSANPFDVAGAKSFGFWVCRIDRAGVPLEELPGQPDLTVPDLTALARHLGA